jgi:hypothetical protein
MTRWLLASLIAGALLTPVAVLAQSSKPSGPPVTDPFKNPPPEEKKKDRPVDREDRTADREEKVDLRPRFEKGQVIRFRMEMDQNNKTLIPAVDEKPSLSTSRQELGLVFKVKEAHDAGSIVELTFSRVKLTKKTDEDTEEFDSSQPPAKDNPQLGPSLRALTKTTFTIHLDKDGNVTRIDGGDDLMALDAFGVPPGAFNPGSGTAPQPGVGGGAFKQALGEIFRIKNGPGLVSVGEEWTNADSMDTGLLGGFKITSKHKLRSHNGGEAKVSVIGSIEANSESPGILSIIKIRDSSFVGDYLWNTREGMLRRMNMHQHVVLETSSAGGITLTSDMKTTVTRN